MTGERTSFCHFEPARKLVRNLFGGRISVADRTDRRAASSPQVALTAETAGDEGEMRRYSPSTRVSWGTRWRT